MQLLLEFSFFHRISFRSLDSNCSSSHHILHNSFFLNVIGDCNDQMKVNCATEGLSN